MWNRIKQRAGNKNGKEPYYKNIKLLLTREEFIEWVTPKLTLWFNLYGSFEDISIDRILEDGHYEISNLQLLSMNENRKKQRHHKNFHAPDGFAWCSKCGYNSINEFYKDKSRLNGFASRCKKHWK